MEISPLILPSPSRGMHADQNEIAAVLAPLFEQAKDLPSLIASRSTVQIDGAEFELPKFLLLGQRGGGKPIRLALFGGLDAAGWESTAALARVLSQFERRPSLARDFALFAYPVANVRGFVHPPEPFAGLARRFVARQSDADLEYFRKEALQWRFDGMISYRLDPDASAFYATVRSELLAREVVAPALGALAPAFRIATEQGLVVSASKVSAPMSLSPRVGELANPFVVEIFAPGGVAIEQRGRRAGRVPSRAPAPWPALYCVCS